jgi:hypothetical protein
MEYKSKKKIISHLSGETRLLLALKRQDFVQIFVVEKPAPNKSGSGIGTGTGAGTGTIYFLK